jgi:hypothetical protein
VADRIATPAYLVTASSTDCLTSCMPSKRGGFTTPLNSFRRHTNAQVSGAAEGWVAGRCEAARSAVPGKSLARPPRGPGDECRPGGPRPQPDGTCGAGNEAGVDPFLDSLPAERRRPTVYGAEVPTAPVAGTAAPSARLSWPATTVSAEGLLWSGDEDQLPRTWPDWLMRKASAARSNGKVCT